MSEYVILVSIPGLREKDLDAMPRLAGLVGGGDSTSLVPSFPAVTCPVQANMTTGVLAREHGVLAHPAYVGVVEHRQTQVRALGEILVGGAIRKLDLDRLREAIVSGCCLHRKARFPLSPISARTA